APPRARRRSSRREANRKRTPSPGNRMKREQRKGPRPGVGTRAFSASLEEALILPIEDVVADGGDPGQAPAGMDPPGVKEERARRRAVGEVLHRDLGDGDGDAPVARRPRRGRDRSAANEGEL